MYAMNAANCCDLLSTNDLWQRASSNNKITTKLWFCFQQTIFDNNVQQNTTVIGLWFAFNKRSLTTPPAQPSTAKVVICFQQTIFDNWIHWRNQPGLVVIWLSTNDLWQPVDAPTTVSMYSLWFGFQQTIFGQRSACWAKANVLWFAFNKRSLTTLQQWLSTRSRLWFAFNKRSLTTSCTHKEGLGLFVICFSTNDLWQQRWLSHH